MAESDLEQTGSQTQTTNQTTSLDPWAQWLQGQAFQQQQNYLNSIYQTLQQPGPYYYPGQLVAPMAPQSLAANAMTTQAFTDPRTYSSVPLAGLAQDYVTQGNWLPAVQNQTELAAFLASPRGIDPTANPFTAAAADAANRQTVSTLSNQILPQIRSSAVSAGQFGGSRQGVAEGQAIAGAAQAISDTNAKVFFEQYNRNVENALRSQALTPQTISAPMQMIGAAQQARGVANQQMLQGFTALDAAGRQLQMQEQAIIDAEVQRYMFNNTIGLEKLGIWAGVGNVLTNPAAYGSGSVTSGTAQTDIYGMLPYTSPLQGALSGGLAGYGIASMLFPGYGWAGAGIGALLGLGLF